MTKIASGHRARAKQGLGLKAVCLDILVLLRDRNSCPFSWYLYLGTLVVLWCYEDSNDVVQGAVVLGLGHQYWSRESPSWTTTCAQRLDPGLEQRKLNRFHPLLSLLQVHRNQNGKGAQAKPELMECFTPKGNV